MKTCKFKSYDELPIFLNAELIAETLGIAVSSVYEIMHEKDFKVVGACVRTGFPALLESFQKFHSASEPC